VKNFGLDSAFVFLNGILISALLLGGCSQQKPSSAINPLAKHGNVLGGQQPVAGATVQLYSVGTAGDGSAATPLLAPPITTDTNGGFSLPNSSSYCPSPSTLVYIVATGGNPGLPAGTNNAALSLMTALGPCGNLTSSTFININELTTVAAVWALAPYMNSYSAVGSSTADAAGLANAFTLASEFVNTSTGTVPGLNVPAGMTVPVDTINTIADILAACVNSVGGVAGDGSVCGMLLSAATPVGGAVPMNVVAAAINIADNPGANVASLFGLITAAAPDQPTLTAAPSDYTLRLILPSTLSISPISVTFPSTVLFINSSAETVTLTNTGATAIPLYAVTISGTNSGDFTQVNNCSLSLEAGTSCTVQVTFTPSDAGERNAYLNIADGSPNPMQSVALTGMTTTNQGGQAGPVSFSSSSLTFTQLGMPQQVIFSNLGLTALTIQSINLSSGYSQTNNCGGTLNAQSTCTITVSLVDPSVGSTASLVVFDDAAAGYQALQLNIPVSNGLPPPGGTTASPLFFGAEDIGVVSSSQFFNAAPGVSGETPVSAMGTITGTNASDFVFVGSNSCFGLGDCSIALAFEPTASGYRTATLSTNYGSVSLNGVGNPGGPAAFLLSPPLVTLNAGIGGSITVSNIGGTTLELSETLGGPNPDNFLFSPEVSTCGTTLAPGTSCQLSVEFFGPGYTVVGTRGATFTVTDTVSGVQHSVYMTGIGTYPSPTVTYSLAFDYNTQVGLQSAPQTATATAPDGHALTVQLVQGGANYQILSPEYCPGGATCSITVVFLPTSTQFVEGQILITDTTTGKTATLELDGIGGLPALTLSSPTLLFAARDVGSPSTLETATLTNTGNGLLLINGIAIMGANPNDFQVTNTCSIAPHGYLDSGQSCTISVSFNPTASGSRTAYIQILSSAASSPDTLQLSGTGN
jgi:hypothetical protein